MFYDDPKVMEVCRVAKTAREESYTKWVKAMHLLSTDRDPKSKALMSAANAGLTRTKLLGPGQVHVDATLSTLSIQYVNGEYIGTMLMPPAPVPKLSDKYYIYDKRNRLAYPDDLIATRGDANEVNESRSLDNYSCQDYGYKNFLDVNTIANQDAPLDEMVDLTEAINEGIAFRRELRIATKVTDPNSYPTGNKVTLAGTDQWDSGTGGDPVKNLQDAKAALWHGRGPGILRAWSSLEVYNVLARHQRILDLFKYGGTTPGLATPKMIAQYFGFDDYVIGEARQDTANEAQAASYGRIWGKHFGITRVATRPSIRNAAFGFTMRFGEVATDQWFDISKGKSGGYYARVSVSEDHKVVAADTSYLIQNATS